MRKRSPAKTISHAFYNATRETYEALQESDPSIFIIHSTDILLTNKASNTSVGGRIFMTFLKTEKINSARV